MPAMLRARNYKTSFPHSRDDDDDVGDGGKEAVLVLVRTRLRRLRIHHPS